MKLKAIKYKQGYIFVDESASCPKGSIVIFPNTVNGSIKNFDSCEVRIAEYDYAANGVHNLLVVAQTVELNIENLPHVDINFKDIEEIELHTESDGSPIKYYKDNILFLKIKSIILNC